MTLDKVHSAHAQLARELYIAGRSPADGAEDWHAALRDARQLISAALRATSYLEELAKGLAGNGSHMLVLRHLLAPPMSQDQFKLLSPKWSKTAERNSSPASARAAAEAAVVVSQWLDPAIVPWLGRSRLPTRLELRRLMTRTASLIATQRVATATRTRLSQEQEAEVVALLVEKGWKKLPSQLIDTRAAVPPMHFMHKTRFATNTAAHQEVDIACGLQKTYVLAMECKVTNDETNSVKRVNDVLKKAAAWQAHWGSFVKTAALLQGVVAAKDVQRLLDGGVNVFWSHDLAAFSEWIDDQLGK